PPGVGVALRCGAGPPPRAGVVPGPRGARQHIGAGMFDDARREYAAVARAIAAFEPVIMVTDPGQASEARDHCGAGIEILPVPIDDSWIRDNGPVFVRGRHGQLALVHFQFNAWGGRYPPFHPDPAVPPA